MSLRSSHNAQVYSFVIEHRPHSKIQESLANAKVNARDIACTMMAPSEVIFGELMQGGTQF